MNEYEGANGINTTTYSELSYGNYDGFKFNTKSQIDNFTKLLESLLEHNTNVVKLEMSDDNLIGEWWKNTALKAARISVESIKQKLIRTYKNNIK